jgi:hypothetical protein
MNVEFKTGFRGFLNRLSHTKSRWWTWVFSLGIVFTGYGQGTVLFINSEVVGGDHLVYLDFVGGTALLGTNFVAELYYGASGTDPSMLIAFPSSISSFRMNGDLRPGTWSGSKVLELPIGGVNVPLTFDIRVWDITQAASYEAARAGGGALGPFGESGAFPYVQVLSAPPSITDTEMVYQPPFALIPEPPFLSLALLGLGALVLIARKR